MIDRPRRHATTCISCGSAMRVHQAWRFMDEVDGGTRSGEARAQASRMLRVALDLFVTINYANLASKTAPGAGAGRTIVQVGCEFVGTDVMAHAPAQKAMAKRYVSEPLLALLHQTGISPRDLDAALEPQANRWAYMLLRKSHVYVRRIRASTGCDVVGISRKHRRLLVDIEQRAADGSIAWHYREFGRANCLFRCRGTIPDTAAAGLPGRPLGTLIQPFPALAAARVNALVATDEGCIELTVEPGWNAF